MDKQTGIFECLKRAPAGQPHLIGDDDCCVFCGQPERALELAFDEED